MRAVYNEYRTNRAHQANTFSFFLKSQVDNQKQSSSTARASVPRSLLGPKGPRVVLPLRREWSGSPDPGLLMRPWCSGTPAVGTKFPGTLSSERMPLLDWLAEKLTAVR